MERNTDDSERTKPAASKKSKTLVECLARITIASLPHFVITLIFVVYLLLGSAILNEVEISEQNTLTHESIDDNKANVDGSFTSAAAASADSAGSAKQASYESYLMFNKYKLKLNDIYLNVLFNIREHQSHISSDYKRFLNKLDKILVDEIYNKTDESDHIRLGDTTTKSVHSYIFDPADDELKKEIKYLNTKKFISKVYKIQNDNSIFLLQTIANHLIETKNDLRMNISKNIKQLIGGYKRKHKNSEKKLFEFIRNQEEMFRQKEGPPTETVMQENQANTHKSTEKFEQRANRTFFKSVFFLTTLMAKIGKILMLSNFFIIKEVYIDRILSVFLSNVFVIEIVTFELIM